jgi:queuosine precursor transporter
MAGTTSATRLAALIGSQSWARGSTRSSSIRWRFLGAWPASLVLTVMGSNYLIKVGWETLMTPFTHKIVGRLKRAEQGDYFDRTTDLNPFTLKT